MPIERFTFTVGISNEPVVTSALNTDPALLGVEFSLADSPLRTGKPGVRVTGICQVDHEEILLKALARTMSPEILNVLVGFESPTLNIHGLEVKRVHFRRVRASLDPGGSIEA